MIVVWKPGIEVDVSDRPVGKVPLVWLVPLRSRVTMPWFTTPWVWPARPPHDVGGALCAAAVFAAGALLVTVRGTRESVRD